MTVSAPQLLRAALIRACCAAPCFDAWPLRIDGVPISFDAAGVIAYALEGHRLIIGDPGEGKGTAVFAPMLLHDVRGWNGRRAGMVVIDPKDGELVRLTRPVRMLFSSPVYTLDPFGLAGDTDGCNPLDLLNPEDIDFFARCAGLARAIIGEPDDDGKDGVRWQIRARELLTGVLGHLASDPGEEKSLMRVRAIIRSDAGAFERCALAMTSNRAAPPFVRQTGAELLRLLAKAPKEWQGYMSVLSQYTEFTDEPRLARILARSTFDWSHVRDSGATVYVTVPDAELGLAAPWLRLMIEVSLQVLRCAHLPAERRRAAADVHILIDEARALGTWRMIEDGLRALRSERISLHLAYQNLAQIRATWREGYTRITAVKLIQFLGSNDTETCEWIAKLAGETTVIDRSSTSSASEGHSWNQSRTTTKGASSQRGWTRSRGETRSEGHTRTRSEAEGRTRQHGYSAGHSSSKSHSRTVGASRSLSDSSGYSTSGGGSSGRSNSVSTSDNEMYVGTFHSVCLRLLEDNREFTRLKRSFTLFDQFDQQYFLYQRLNEFRSIADIEAVIGPDQSGRWSQSEQLLKWLNKIGEEALDVQRLANAADIEMRALASAFVKYQELLAEANSLDFSGIQCEALRLLSEHPEVLARVRAQIRYLMVDEYQDTNTVQERILMLLAGDQQNLCVVGDDDQGLYRFRGATIRNILEFAGMFAEVARYLNRRPLEVEQILSNTAEGLPKLVEAVSAFNELLYDELIPRLFRALYDLDPEQETEEHEVELVKIPPSGYYEVTADKAKLVRQADVDERVRGKSFHLDAYSFDSVPEHTLFWELLKSGRVKKIYFTGMLTHGQSDFFVQYIDPDSHTVRSYYPDFLFQRDDDTFVIVEVKADNQIEEAVVQAKQDFATQMAVASGMEYKMVKATSASSGAHGLLS